jgi:hypothetical protein
MRTCHLSAFSIATGISEDVLIGYLGHDGSEIIFPGEEEPVCRRGFHVQELLFVGHKLGHFFMPLELVPAIQSQRQPHKTHIIGDEQRFDYIAKSVEIGTGFITGATKRCAHAVAFKLGDVFDGELRYRFDEHIKKGFIPQTVWIKA